MHTAIWYSKEEPRFFVGINFSILIVILITHDIYHSWIVNIQLAAVLVLPDKAHYF